MMPSEASGRGHTISPELAASLWQRARSPGPATTTTNADAQAQNFASLSPPLPVSAQQVDCGPISDLGGDAVELDRDWVGGLAREEVEALLFHANSVIHERERDLGIAAAIGQALLQKNISLRTKHEQVMHRLSQSEHGQDDIDEQDENFGHLMDQLPNNDNDVTPLANKPSQVEDYFTNHNSQQSPKPRPALGQIFGQPTFARFSESSHRLAGLVPSVPSSPGGMSASGDSVYSLASKAGSSRQGSRRVKHRHSSSLQTSETHKQLSSLSAQNEALLSQLAELQDEAEDAKREGGKKLRRLNREIEGLQRELEAATQRNVELERVQSEATTKPETPAKRQPMRDNLAASPSPIRPSPSKSTLASIPSISGGVDALLKRSESGLDSQQKALILRLVDKMKELEATNKTLQGQKEEREGRLGAALEQGVRISDEYDAVLHAHDTEMSMTMAHHANESLAMSRSSSATSSPQKHRRRALGNRVQVEGRKTIRSALRSQKFTPLESANAVDDHGDMTVSHTGSSLASYLYDSSTGVSASSSVTSLSDTKRKPRRVRSALALNRPRILITPSMEDIAAKRKEQEEGWEDDFSSHSHAIRPPRDRSHSLDPSDAEKIALNQRIRSAESQQSPTSPRQVERRESLASTDSTLTDPHDPSPISKIHYIAQEHGSGLSASDAHYRRYREQFQHHLGDDSPPRQAHASLSGSPYLQRRRSRQQYPRDASLQLIEAGAKQQQQHQHSLGSELGSVFGDDVETTQALEHYNDTGRDRLSVGANNRLRPVASYESLRAPSEAASDIAHLRWATDTAKPVRPLFHALRTLSGGREKAEADPRGDSLDVSSGALVAMSRTTSVANSLHDGIHADGDWLPGHENEAGQVTLGSLRDRLDPDDEHYTSLSDALRNRPVQWADDDDYGVPLKESEARRLKLAPPRSTLTLQAAASGRRNGSTALNLLSWVTGVKPRGQRHSDKAAVAMLQTQEQLEEQERCEGLLRAKYRLARRRRLLLEHGSGLVDEDEDEEQELEDRYRSLVKSLTPRKSGDSNAASKKPRAWYDRPLLDTPNRRRSMLKPRDGSDDEDVVLCGDNDRIGENAQYVSRRRADAATSNGVAPLSLRRTSRPRGGKRATARAKAAEAVDEVTAWVSLVFVLILAFFVSASRGPKQILGGAGNNDSPSPPHRAAPVRPALGYSDRTSSRGQQKTKKQHKSRPDEAGSERGSAASSGGGGGSGRGGAGAAGSATGLLSPKTASSASASASASASTSRRRGG